MVIYKYVGKKVYRNGIWIGNLYSGDRLFTAKRNLPSYKKTHNKKHRKKRISHGIFGW
jgi:hypothetical protein